MTAERIAEINEQIKALNQEIKDLINQMIMEENRMCEFLYNNKNHIVEFNVKGESGIFVLPPNTYGFQKVNEEWVLVSDIITVCLSKIENLKIIYV